MAKSNSQLDKGWLGSAWGPSPPSSEAWTGLLHDEGTKTDWDRRGGGWLSLWKQRQDSRREKTTGTRDRCEFGGGGVTPGHRSQLNIRPQDLGSRPCRGPGCRSTSGSPGLKRSVALGSWAAGRPQIPRTLGSWSPQAPGNPIRSSAKHIHQMSEPPVSLVLNRITLATTHHQ